MDHDEMSADEFQVLFEGGKEIANRMVEAAGARSMQEMMMSIGIIMAEFANQSADDHDGKLKAVDDLAYTARSVLEWAKANAAQGNA